MGKKNSFEERSKPPSQRHYVKHMKVPEGCVDVWRINVANVRVSIDSQWFSRDKCMAEADRLHAVRRRGVYVYVEHKAAIKIGDKFHIVNIPSFTPKDAVLIDPESLYRFPPEMGPSVTAVKVQDDDPDHKKWVAEFEGGGDVLKG